MSISVDVAKAVNEELHDAVAGLLPQLSSARPPGVEELQLIIDDPDTSLFIGRVDGTIRGMLTLVMFRIPTGVKAWIEDVVVDGEARGHGLGEALNRAALEWAAEHGAKAVSLTSRPSREDANRLYRRLGFVQRETNMYRYEL